MQSGDTADAVGTVLRANAGTGSAEGGGEASKAGPAYLAIIYGRGCCLLG
jgi:hypothetical protein